MARLSTYSKDTSITGDDKLIGSNYGGLDNQGRPIFTTANYKVSDLLTYFQDNISVSGTTIVGLKDFQLNLADSLGTYSSDGTITALSSAFVNQFATAEAGNKFATATFQTNVESSVLTFDGQGNATVAEAFANQVITTTSSDRFATSTYAQNIGSSFGTVASDGTVTLSESFANSVITTTSSNRFATSSKLDNVIASVGTDDGEGNITLSTSFANSVITTTTSDKFATSEYAQNLGSSIGTVDASGNITVSEAFANSVMNTETATDYASASSVTSLASTVSTKPDIFRQISAPSTSNAVGSLWYDTDDNNKVYVLVAGDPNVWTLTDDSRIGSLVTSTATINQTLSTHTSDISANATFATGLASSFGTYDSETGEITALSTSFANAVMTTENTTDYASASSVTELNTQFVFTNGQITGTSGAISTEIASAQSSATNAAASKVEDLAANFFTGYDAADGSYTATSLSADFKTAVNAEVDANSSTADYVSNLSAAVGIDKTDGSTLQATAYINNGTAYTTTATVDGAVANSKEITITASNSNIEAGQYVTYSTQTSTTNRDVVFRVVSVSNITVVLDNDISLEDQTVLTFTGKSTYNIDNLSGTIVDGFQVKGSNITVGTYVVDYTAPVLTLSRAEVLVDDTFLQFLGVYAAVTETASVVANIDGSLQSTYGLQVDADGKIAGMKLFANNEGSEIAFTADSFKVYNGTTNYSPFKVENDTVYIKTVKFGDIENLPSYFVVTVVYADDASGTNASTTKGSKNYYGIFQGVNAWEDGDSVVGITFNQITGNAGTNGINAKVVKLTPSKHVINYNTDGTESDSITFTTEVQNIINSVTYRFDIVNNAGSVTTGTASATSTFTLNDADEPAEGERTTVKVYVFENGTQVATDSVTIYAVKDGSSAVTGFLTNASHTCSADNDGGNPVLTGSGGDFKVFVGGTDVSSSCTFSVVSYTSGLSIAIDSSSGAYTITGLTVDTANAVLKAVVPAATAGTAADVEITQTYSISKSIKGDTGLTGASGSNAKIIKLTPSKHVINYTESGSESDTIDFTTSVQNIEGTATYRFYINGTAQGTGATTTSTFTLPDANEPAAGSVTVVKVDVYDDLVLAASDSVSIYGVQDGSDAIVGFLTNAAHVVAASNNGTVSSFTGAGGTFNVFVGGTNVTTNCTFSVSSETGVDVSIGAATGIYTVNSMSADSGTAVFSAVIPAAVAKTVGNITITSNYSISKSIKGDTGDTGPAGTDSKSVIISASPQHVVLYDGDDNKTAVAIVLTATPVNLTSPQYRFLKDGVEKQAFSTTATYTIPDTEEPSSNTSNLWKVEAREGTGSTIAFDSLTVYGVKDGSDVYTAILSNESHVLPTTTAGTVTYTGSGTTIQVYKGNSLLNFTTDTPANNTFTISTSASNIARGTESGSGTDTYTVGDHSNMSATNASITYTITAYGLSQTGTVEAKATIVKKQSFAKSQQGATGAQGPQGPDGTDALRTVSGVLFWSVGQSTAPTKPIYSSGNPTGTEVVYTYSTGVFSGNGLDTNGGTVGVWQKASPQMAAGTAANDYWTVDYTILQADPSDTTATLSGGEIIFGTVTKSFAFNQVVTFSSLSTSGSTTINGDNITTGAIDSTNYQYTSGNFSTFGTKFDLSTGTITSKNFYINGGTGAAGFAGWTIDTDSIKSPAISSVHNLQLYSTASNGLLVRDSEGTTSVQIKYGGLSTLTPTTTSGITFVDVDNVEFGSFSGTITSGAVSPSSPESLYKTTGTTYLTGSNLAAGSYTYNITVAAITSALATITGTAKTTISLWVEFATDTAFANVIKSALLVSKNQTGAGTITFEETTKEIPLSIDSNITSLYARFYWQRNYAVPSGSSIVYTARTFNISSANANNDLVFSKYKGRTEITNEGFQVINDPSTYFKIDREGYTSADPYVSIGGKLKVDGDVEVTGTINLSGEINNSDVTIDNLIERLGEINSNTYLGNSTGVTFTLRDNLIVDGNLTVNGTTVTVNTTNLSVADNLIHVGDNNNLNTVDLGIIGHYSNDSGTTANHVGLFWDASATNWKFFEAYTKDELETTTVDTAHSSFTLGDVEAGSFTGSSFIKSGGTSTQFLKADGSVDSSTYLTSYTETDTLGTVTARSNTTGYALVVTNVDSAGNVQPSSNNIRVSGYGIIGNRGTFYVTNGGGDVQIGNGTTHNANPSASFSSTGISLQRPTGVTGTLSATSTITAGGSISTSATGYVEVKADQTDSAAVKIGVSSGSNEAFLMADNTGAGHITGDSKLKMLVYNSSGSLIESGRFTTTGLGIGTTSPIDLLNANKENAESKIVISRGGTNLATSTSIGKLDFYADYEGSPTPYANINAYSNALSGVRSSLGFNVKSTSGNILTGLTVYGTNSGVNVGIGTIVPDAQLEISNSESGTGIGGASLRLTRKETTVVSEDPIGIIEFYNTDADGAHISSFIKGVARETYGRKGALTFGVATTNSTNAVEAMRINESGDLNLSNNLSVSGTITSSSSIAATAYYDLDNTSYYVDPAGNSVLAGNLTVETVLNVYNDSNLGNSNDDDTTLAGRLLNTYTGTAAHQLQNATTNGTVLQLTSTTDSRILNLQTDHIYSNGNFYIGDNTYQTTFRGSYYYFENAPAVFKHGNVYFGEYSNTNGGRLHIEGTTADRRSIIQTTNGNLHIDSHDGYSIYLNYYTGGSSTNVVFGTGNSGAAAQVNADGSARFPIYYDYNNTNYYVDPSNTGMSAVLAGRMELIGTAPIIEMNDSDATSTTNQLGYISYQINGTESGYVGYGSSNNSYLYVRNSDGIIYNYGTYTLHANSSRAPIFYDSDNTNRYLDPSSLSVLTRLNLYTDSDGGVGLNIARASATGRAQMQLLNESGSALWRFGATGPGSSDFAFYDGSNNVLTLTGGYAIANASMRAPIFYDSDNTSYFLNLASGNTNTALNINGQIYRDGFDTSSNGGNNKILVSQDYSSWIWNTATNWGIFWAGNDNAAYTFFSTTNPNELNFVGGGTLRASIDLDNGQSYFATSVRSPIFYDSNNTGYYVDPASTSNLNALNVGGSSVSVSGHTHDDRYLVKGGSWNGSNMPGSRWNGFSANGGEVVFQQDNPNTGQMSVMVDGNFYAGENNGFWSLYSSNSYNSKAGMYANSSGYLILDTPAGGRVKVKAGTSSQMNINHDQIWTDSGNLHFQYSGSGNIDMNYGGGYTFSRTSLRAPVFYDYNNTNRYVDPASTSVLNEVQDPQGSYYVSYKHSGSDFANGTLVATNITANNTNGDSFVIEVTGKSYSSAPPFSFMAQGYLYNNTIINTSGVNNGDLRLSYIKVMELNGYLHFWWPRVSYWNSFEVRVRDAGGNPVNRVTSISNSADPSGATKKVQINLAMSTLYGYNTNAGDLYAVKYFDADNTAYYVDPASTSNIRKTNIVASGSGWNDGLNLYSSDATNRWNLLVDDGASDQFRIAYNSTERMRFETGGNVTTIGIAYSNDSFRAPIFYDSNDTNYYVDPNGISYLNALTATRIGVNPSGSSSTQYGISLYGGYSSGEPTYGLLFTGTGLGTHGSVTGSWATYFTMNNDTTRGWIFRRVGSGNCASISAGGHAAFNGDVTAYYSDMRLKTKIADIENPIEKVKSLSGFIYEPNEIAESYGYEKERKVGVSAQEVQVVLPEAVKDAPIGDGYLTVQYDKLIPLLIEAIKEQQKQIEELKAIVDGLTK